MVCPRGGKKYCRHYEKFDRLLTFWQGQLCALALTSFTSVTHRSLRSYIPVATESETSRSKWPINLVFQMYGEVENLLQIRPTN